MTVFLGVLTLIWLSTESTIVPITAILAVCWSIAIFGLLIMHNFAGRELIWRWFLPLSALTGSIIGATTAVIGFLLMLFKNVQHSHLTPDFPNETLLGMLERTPVWAIAGAFLGIAFALYTRIQVDEG